MGVMGCFRNGCEHIMCNRLSHIYGYICNECFNQLLESDLTIEAFMNSIKEDFKKRENREKELNEEFFILQE